MIYSLLIVPPASLKQKSRAIQSSHTEVPCYILEPGLVRMGYITLSNSLTETIEKILSVGENRGPERCRLPKFDEKLGGRDCLGVNLSLSPLTCWAFSDFSAYDPGVIEIKFINFFFQSYITKSSKAESVSV